MQRTLIILACLCVSPGAMAGPVQRAAEKTKPFSLQYVPENPIMLLALRPSELLRHKSVKPAADEVSAFFQTAMGTDLENLEAWYLGMAFPSGEQPGRFRPLLYQLFVSHKPNDYSALRGLLASNAVKKSHNGVEYFQSGRECFLRIDERTLLLAENERSMLPLIETGAAGKTPARWKPHWEKIKSKPGAFMIDFVNFRKAIANDQPPPGIFADIAPMWEKAEAAAASLDLTKRIKIDAVSVSPTADAAAEARKAMMTGLDFARQQTDEAIQQIDSQMSRMADDPRSRRFLAEMKIADATLGLIRKPMDGIEVEQDGSLLTASASISPIAVGRAAGKLAPLLRRMRADVMAEARTHNLRQLALAMHNYHDAYNEFPPAYKMGKDGNGKHKVSWRVLVLPFLGQQALYEQYKFDEPWDSPANKRVTARMPAYFRAVNSKPGTTNTDYFVIVGENTAGKVEKGRKLREFTDGSSNSLLVVESRKGVHWAQPIDIEMPKEGLPKLGGVVESGFRIARADGSVGFIRTSADQEQLWRLLTINDGKVVNQDLVGTEPVDDE